MSDNIIIFGAGASFDAGIPLMNGFVERMWELAIRGSFNGKPLTAKDQEIFEKAKRVRDDLDSYHGRATFDDRNIEDILSILTFNIMGNLRADRDKLNWMNKAISRTIELSCTVKHTGKFNKIITEGNDIYRIFWQSLFKWFNKGNKLPTIITFNYDLAVLIAGDRDYLPLVDELKRLGKIVCICFFASKDNGMSEELKLAADHFIEIDGFLFHYWKDYLDIK